MLSCSTRSSAAARAILRRRVHRVAFTFVRSAQMRVICASERAARLRCRSDRSNTFIPYRSFFDIPFGSRQVCHRYCSVLLFYIEAQVNWASKGKTYGLERKTNHTKNSGKCWCSDSLVYHSIFIFIS